MNELTVKNEDVLSNIKVELTQSDLIDVAVSEIEEKLIARRDELKKEIDANNKVYNELTKKKQKYETDLANHHFSPKIKGVEIALKALDKSAEVFYNPTTVTSSEEYEYINVSPSFSFTTQKRGSVSIPLGTQSLKTTGPMRTVVKKMKERDLELKDLQKDLYDIQAKLNDMPRYIRQARARLTKQIIKDSNIKVPQLSE